MQAWYNNFTLDGDDKLVSMDYLSMAMTKLTNSPDPGTNRFLLKKIFLGRITLAHHDKNNKL